jgi:hypothetical protein
LGCKCRYFNLSPCLKTDLNGEMLNLSKN